MSSDAATVLRLRSSVCAANAQFCDPRLARCTGFLLGTFRTDGDGGVSGDEEDLADRDELQQELSEVPRFMLPGGGAKAGISTLSSASASTSSWSGSCRNSRAGGYVRGMGISSISRRQHIQEPDLREEETEVEIGELVVDTAVGGEAGWNALHRALARCWLASQS